MTFISLIESWLKEYDTLLKALGAIATPGGIWIWFDKYRNRIRVRVHSLAFPPGDPIARTIVFEAENICDTLTSLEPTFTMTGLTPERVMRTYTFTIDGKDRQLSPHIPKQILAVHNNKENGRMLFLWYMTFTIPLTRGSTIKLRYRNANREILGFFRFHLERLQFKWVGKVPG